MYVCVFSSVPCASASQPPKESYIQWLWCSKSIFKPLSGESEAHTTPETLSRVCSGASAATGYFDTTPRMATTVASAPVLRSCPKSQPAQVVSCYFNPSLPLSIHEVWHQASTQAQTSRTICVTMPAYRPCSDTMYLAWSPLSSILFSLPWAPRTLKGFLQKMVKQIQWSVHTWYSNHDGLNSSMVDSHKW